MRGIGKTALFALPLAAAASGAAAVLFRFDPMQVDFYPRCPLLVFTGIYCPGCGGLRAMHALLHGDVAAAFGFNPLLMLTLPFLAYALLSLATDASLGRRLPAPYLPGRGIWALFGVIMVFTVLRNLPYYPLVLLAP